jgi:hypothetical protein
MACSLQPVFALGFGLSPLGFFSVFAYSLWLAAYSRYLLWALGFRLWAFFCIRLQLMACSLRPVFSLGFLLSAFGLQLMAYSLQPAATSACHIY